MTARNPMTPENTRAGARSIEDELPALVGDDWSQMEEYFHKYLRQLETTEGTEQRLAAMNLMDLFADYPDARKHLRQAILMQDDLSSTLLAMASMTKNVDPNFAQQLEKAASPGSETRKAMLKAPDKGKSFKLANIEFHIGEMHALAVAILTIIAERMVGDDVKPFAIAVGILAIAGKLMEEMTVDFDEREATVLWGFAEVADKEQSATEQAIREAANSERQKIGLKALDEAETRNALHKLELLKTVKQVDEHKWRITERI